MLLEWGLCKLRVSPELRSKEAIGLHKTIEGSLPNTGQRGSEQVIVIARSSFPVISRSTYNENGLASILYETK